MREFFPLKVETPPEWAQTAIKDMDQFLLDHAMCERKAAATCMSLAMTYPEKLELCDVMITVAREEMEHFQQVFRMAKNRGLPLQGDLKDPYVIMLMKEVRTSKDGRFMDRLLVSAIVEARSCERLGLVGQALLDSEDSHEQDMGKYYSELALAEARHFGLFIKFAKKYCPQEEVDKRFDELLNIEVTIIKDLPWRPAVH